MYNLDDDCEICGRKKRDCWDTMVGCSWATTIIEVQKEKLGKINSIMRRNLTAPNKLIEINRVLRD